MPNVTSTILNVYPHLIVVIAFAYLSPSDLSYWCFKIVFVRQGASSQHNTRRGWPCRVTLWVPKTVMLLCLSSRDLGEVLLVAFGEVAVVVEAPFEC